MSLRHSLSLAVSMTACTPSYETVEGDNPALHDAAKYCEFRGGQPVVGTKEGILGQVTHCLDLNNNRKIDRVIYGRPEIEAWQQNANGTSQYQMGNRATELLSK